MRILFLTPRFPYPPFKGDQLRAWNVIRLLSESHTVTVVTYASSRVTAEHFAALEPYAAIHTRPFYFPRRIAGALRSVPLPEPLQVGLYRSGSVRRTVDHLLPEHDAVHLNTVRMAGNLPATIEQPAVVDFIDALGASTARYAAEAPLYLSPLLRFEARRLKRYERHWAGRAAFSCAVSEPDANVIGPNVQAVRHGVDTERFRPPPSDAPRNGVVFTGNLAYPPNNSAVRELIYRIFPKVRDKIPDATLRIAGVNPPRWLERYRGPGVYVAGPVERMEDELRSAAAAVAPIRFGGGVQTKILEALACGTPVVATPFANSGIEAPEGRGIQTAETAKALAESIVALLGDPDRCRQVGMEGRAFVERTFAWRAALEPLAAWYRAQ